MEYEKFTAKVWVQGTSLIITIPEKVARFGDYKKGDELMVLTKKEVQDESPS